MATRRDFFRMSNMLGLTWLLTPSSLLNSENKEEGIAKEKPSDFITWEDGSRLVLSISMQFESGGQVSSHNSANNYKDLYAESWDRYGYKEGIPRLLELWDRYNIKVTSHMTSAAALKNQDLAKDIVIRGHEVAVQSTSGSFQNNLSYEEEKKILLEEIEAIKTATGKKPVGYNTNWLRGGENTLNLLQELGFTYYVNDISRDEPFVISVNAHDFAVVPYTLRCNDSTLIEGKSFSSDQFLSQLQLEFDQLYEESVMKRRMMSISLHDRTGGTPQMVLAMKEFLNYAIKHKGITFKRKDEIAAMVLKGKLAIRDY